VLLESRKQRWHTVQICLSTFLYLSKFLHREKRSRNSKRRIETRAYQTVSAPQIRLQGSGFSTGVANLTPKSEPGNINRYGIDIDTIDALTCNQSTERGRQRRVLRHGQRFIRRL